MDTNDKKHTKRRARRPRPEPRRREPRRNQDTKVVYTEARPFNRNRFILQLISMLAVVLALLLGTSIFFKAKKVIVSGTKTYSAYQIKQASGIQDDVNLLTVNGAKVSGRIIKQLPYVQQVRVQIKLPDTVLIEVVEVAVTYAIQDKTEQWWLIDANGKVIESISGAESKGYTQILGVRLDTPTPGEKGVAEEPQPEGTTPDGETVPVTVYGRERLDVVLTVLKNLEKQGMVGNSIVSVDVSSLGNIELWYGEQYRILLGDSQRLDEKIRDMRNTIEYGEYGSGILDFSYTTRPDEVICTPF